MNRFNNTDEFQAFLDHRVPLRRTYRIPNAGSIVPTWIEVTVDYRDEQSAGRVTNVSLYADEGCAAANCIHDDIDLAWLPQDSQHSLRLAIEAAEDREIDRERARIASERKRQAMGVA